MVQKGGALVSMPVIVWASGLFDGTNRKKSEETILKLLAVLVDRNCEYLRVHPSTPKLYDSDVHYALPDQMTRAPDPDMLARLVQFISKDMGYDEETVDIIVTLLHGCEIFRDIPTILKKKAVDCDNLSCFRVAELRCGGIEAVPYIVWRETDRGTTYHALLRWPDGSSEDPSLILGMGGAAREADRIEEKRKNTERYATMIALAQQLCNAGETTPREVGKRIDALGLLPASGSW